MSETQVLYRCHNFCLKTGFETSMDDLKKLEDSQNNHIEVLELAEDGTDHWACNASESEPSDSEETPNKRAKLEALAQEGDKTQQSMPTKSGASTSKALKNKVRKRAKRKADRVAAGNTSKGISLAHVERAKSNVFHTLADISALPHIATGWKGLPPKSGTLPPKTVEMEELDKKGFQGIYWDGRTSGYIADQKGGAATILAGRPSPPNWDDIVANIAHKLENSGEETRVTTMCPDKHRRGEYKALSTGISFGNGQKAPGYLKTDPNQHLVKTLLNDENVKKCVGFAAKSFRAHNEPAYTLYKETLDYTCRSQGLQPNFPNTPWAATTFNVGTNVVTIPHLDSANLAFGWCAITTFGNFNPDRGGHLILWDLRVYIRFPPGSTIFIPSAIVVHSNLPIEEGEKRSSMTHYTAGSLFRWRYNNGRNDKQFEKTASEGEKLQKEWDNKSRWDEASKYFPCVS